MRSGFVRELQKQVYEHEHFAFYEKQFIEACNSNLVPFIIDDKGTGAAVAM
jgi:EAL domain-containing protein (putative c-di-GMP-specific phosphodiesterase class I)